MLLDETLSSFFKVLGWPKMFDRVFKILWKNQNKLLSHLSSFSYLFIQLTLTKPLLCSGDFAMHCQHGDCDMC